MAWCGITDQKKTSRIGRQMGNSMKWVVSLVCVLLSLVASPTFADEAKKAQVVADYSNITTSMGDDPHQSGYAVTLYRRHDGLLFGDFTFAAGTTEGVGGRMFDLHLENGWLTFKAKTSAYDGPSRELFDFKGKVRGGSLVGTLTVWNGYDLKKPESVRSVKLKRVKTAMPLSYEAHQKIFQHDAW
jgi:hypothetical protein